MIWLFKSTDIGKSKELWHPRQSIGVWKKIEKEQFFDLRHHTAENGEEQELSEHEVGVESLASARHERREAMASATRLASSGRRDCQLKVRRWGGGKKETGRKAAGFETAIHQIWP